MAVTQMLSIRDHDIRPENFTKMSVFLLTPLFSGVFVATRCVTALTHNIHVSRLVIDATDGIHATPGFELKSKIFNE